MRRSVPLSPVSNAAPRRAAAAGDFRDIRAEGPGRAAPGDDMTPRAVRDETPETGVDMTI